MERGTLLVLAYITLLTSALWSLIVGIAAVSHYLLASFILSRYGWLVVLVLVSYLEIYLYVERTCA